MGGCVMRITRWEFPAPLRWLLTWYETRYEKLTQSCWELWILAMSEQECPINNIDKELQTLESSSRERSECPGPWSRQRLGYSELSTPLHLTTEANISFPQPCQIPATPISNLQLPSPTPGDTLSPTLSDKLLHLQLFIRPCWAAEAQYLPF